MSKQVGPDEIRLSSSASKWLQVLTCGIVTVYVLYLVLFLRKAGPGDSDQYLVFHTLQYWNSELFGLSKQWTPLLCSGLSMAGEPQIPFMSLAMALSYLSGPLWGVKLSLAIYLALGWIGAHLYAGLWFKTAPQRNLAAALFIGNGYFFCRLGLGHFDFAPSLILPLMLWTLHQVLIWSRELPGLQRAVHLLLATLLIGATTAFAIDGSPVTIMHLMFWVSLYAVALSVGARNAAPAALLACACIVASLLDAGYLWPMLEAQAAFPRRTPDTFTSVLSLAWFALLPMRGKVLPANGNGHELSVFIGPILAWCVWRQRRWLGTHLPAIMRTPLLWVSAAAIVLGMGSLKLLHVPAWLSPFDILRPLPGFRSLNVTGRYWGFLALPLSLLSAAALCKTSAELRSGWRLHVMLGLACAMQLGFQSETLVSHWIHSAPYQQIPAHSFFDNGPESIDYVAISTARLQGEVISPTRGVCDCYDMDDFTHAETGPGRELILHVTEDGRPVNPAHTFRAAFPSWNQIQLNTGCGAGDLSSCGVSPASRVQIVLKQAFHSNWKADGCRVSPSTKGNLLLDCPAERLLRAPLQVTFRDAISELGARISLIMWKGWLALFAALLVIPASAAGRRWLRVPQGQSS